AGERTTARIRPTMWWKTILPTKRSGHRLPINESVEQAPKNVSAQEPTDIGDQYLKSGACPISDQPRDERGQPASSASVTNSDLKSMCQNRSGRCRSTMRKMPHSAISGKAVR